MNVHDDVARFRPDDDERLVAASFACPVCPGLDADACLVLERDDSEVECSCSSCRTEWSVAVDAAQVMRLVLHPPDRGTPRRCAWSRTGRRTPRGRSTARPDADASGRRALHARGALPAR
jgi:hypothetical protein